MKGLNTYRCRGSSMRCAAGCGTIATAADLPKVQEKCLSLGWFKIGKLVYCKRFGRKNTKEVSDELGATVQEG